MQAQVDAIRVPVPSARAAGNSLVLAPAGAALFGVAVAFSSSGAGLLPSVVAWAAALPLLSTVTWLLCLPALYIPWAAREPQLTIAATGRAAFASVTVFGICLGATAPIQWFFATTAPGSQWLAALGFSFIWLALIAAHVTFARALEEEGLRLATWAQLLFFALQGCTFFQFIHMVGLRFFPE